jgi:hypothetical protein
MGSDNKLLGSERNKKSIASFATFMISAFWHGFYPIYYLFFFQFYIYEQICEIFEHKFKLFSYFKTKNYSVQLIVK